MPPITYLQIDWTQSDSLLSFRSFTKVLMSNQNVVYGDHFYTIFAIKPLCITD